MKKFILRFVLVVAFVLPVGLGSFVPVGADKCSSVDVLSCACDAQGGDGSGSTVCDTDPTKDPLTGRNGVLYKTGLLLAILAGIAAVIIIIVSAIKYVTANGDAQKAASARNGIVGAAVGLAIIAVSTSIVLFVVSRLNS